MPGTPGGSALGFPLAASLGGDDPYNYYKVQQLILSMPPVWDTSEGTPIGSILTAIGSSDNDIGGK